MRFIAAQRSGPIKSEIHPERITFKESVYIYLLLIPRLTWRQGVYSLLWSFRIYWHRHRESRTLSTALRNASLRLSDRIEILECRRAPEALQRRYADCYMEETIY